MDPEARGDIQSKNVKLQWWIRYQIAASVIQRNFRCWRLRRYIRSQAARRAAMPVAARVNDDVTIPLSTVFRDIINGTASFKETMSFWRAAIELRRAHPSHSTDMIVRALMNSEGDLPRAIVLLGSKDFVMKNNRGDLPPQLRSVFIPHITAFTQSAANSDYLLHSTMWRSMQHAASIPSNSQKQQQHSWNNNGHAFENGEATGKSGLFSNGAGNTHHTGINAIRSLRNSQGQRHHHHHQQHKRSELFEILDDVLAKSYFSKNHVGGSGGSKGGGGTTKHSLKHAQRSPNKTAANVKSRTLLEANDHLNRTMDYLSAKPLV